jgi:fructose-bisphosphate aldolase class I
MDINKLNEVAKKLVAPGKGILAADESDKTIKKRFDTIGLESTLENHRIYRQLLFKTPEIGKYISGVILFDETIRQNTDEGILFAKYLTERSIMPGIKADRGTVEMVTGSLEKVTEGIDGLGERLAEYRSMGAQFTKWRAVITIKNATPDSGQTIPTDECIQKNSDILARFAKISQKNDLVPIVEPEVLMDGDHNIEKCEEVTYKTLKTVFASLSKEGVDISGILLKPNMVISGKSCKEKASSKAVAESTLRCFSECLPKGLPGVVFLSGIAGAGFKGLDGKN